MGTRVRQYPCYALHKLEYWVKISDLCLLIFIDVIEVEIDCFNGGWSVEVYGIRSVNAMVNARWSGHAIW